MKLLTYILRLVVRVVANLLLFYGLVGSIGVIGDDVIRLLVLIERGSWKNLRKNRKIFQDSLGGLENSPYLRSWKS